MRALILIFLLAGSVISFGSTDNNVTFDKDKVEKLAFFEFTGSINEIATIGERQRMFNISNLDVKVVNLTRNKTAFKSNNIDGEFSVKLEKGNQYEIIVEKDGFYSKKIIANVGVNGCVICFESMGDSQNGKITSINNDRNFGNVEAEILLRRIELNNSIRLGGVYFDYQSTQVRDKDKPELDKLVELMKLNPKLKIEVGVHTDTRDNDDVNTITSQSRARSVEYYLLSRGIQSNRIEHKGYGDSQPVIACNSCTEEQHQLNRRVAFKVLEVEGRKFVMNPPRGQEIDIMGYASVNDTSKTYQFGAFGEEITPEQLLAASKKIEEQELLADSRTKEVDFSKEIQADIMDESSFIVSFDDDQKQMCTSFEEESMALALMADPMDYADNSSKGIEEEASDSKFRNVKAKEIPEGYYGYKLEIKTSETELANDDELFVNMGGVFHDITEEGTYSYMIGSFTHLNGAKDFYEKIMKNRYPDAKIVRYKKGKRARK